jgi:hypothetical protein
VSQTIVWTCEACGQPIADGEGYVTVDYADIHAYEAAMRAWEDRVRAKMPAEWRERGGLMFTGADLLDHPETVRWRMLHAACDPRPDSSDYCIAIERIRTTAEAFEWAAHMLEKGWLVHTNWADILRGVASQLEVVEAA